MVRRGTSSGKRRERKREEGVSSGRSETTGRDRERPNEPRKQRQPQKLGSCPYRRGRRRAADDRRKEGKGEGKRSFSTRLDLDASFDSTRQSERIGRTCFSPSDSPFHLAPRSLPSSPEHEREQRREGGSALCRLVHAFVRWPCSEEGTKGTGLEGRCVGRKRRRWVDRRRVVLFGRGREGKKGRRREAGHSPKVALGLSSLTLARCSWEKIMYEERALRTKGRRREKEREENGGKETSVLLFVSRLRLALLSSSCGMVRVGDGD